ncbi:MAG: RHS repeat-associated core domain-containing protein, partial [Armatimonadota bacterium]
NGVGVTAPVLSDGVATMVPGISEKSGGVTSTILSDRMGSMKRLSNAGTVTDTAEFDAFGKVVSRTGTNATQKGFASGFGYQEDGESGYKLLGHRYYDADTGRFLSRDPAFDGRNWYAYCHNNPVNSADPSGLSDGAKLIGIGIYQRILLMSPWWQAFWARVLGVSTASMKLAVDGWNKVQEGGEAALDEATPLIEGAVSEAQVIINRRNGLEYEKKIFDDLIRMGINAIRNPPSIMTPLGRRRPDIAVYEGDEIAYYIECKLGEAVRGEMQFLKDMWIEINKGRPTIVMQRWSGAGGLGGTHPLRGPRFGLSGWSR